MPIAFKNVVELIEGCRRLGVIFSLSGSKLKCAAPAGVMSAGLQAVVSAHCNKIWAVLFSETEPAADGWATMPFADDPKPLPAPVDWPAGVGVLADFVMLLTIGDLPAVPFGFGLSRVVVDRQRFLRSIQGDIRRGAGGPRARLGTLQGDLQSLRDLVICENATQEA